MIPRRRLHRAVFVTAGLYNIGWGLFSALDPQWLFRFAKMPLSNTPQIFACLGMVIGLYGLLYLEVARVPERGWLLAAVGLAGKVLGPIGPRRAHLERRLAPRHRRPLRHERSHLVAPLRALPARRLAGVAAGLALTVPWADIISRAQEAPMTPAPDPATRQSLKGMWIL